MVLFCGLTSSCIRHELYLFRGLYSSRGVCGFKVRVLYMEYGGPDRTYRNSGYGYGSLYRTHRSSGYGMEALQNSQKFRVGIRMLCSFTVRVLWPPGVQKLQKFKFRIRLRICTYLTEVPGTSDTRVNTRLKGAGNNKLIGEIYIYNSCILRLVYCIR